jgi:hypothetical protein
LLSRLRQAIKPDPELPENDRNAKTEYAALQEELMRLTQIEQALRRQLPGDHLPTETSYPYEGEEPMVRRIQICVVPPAGDTEERPKIQALQAPLTDLDAYKTLLRQKTLEECPSTPKRANLVVVPDCTHEGERMPSGEMPDASQAAQLTVESLKESSFELNKAVLQNIKLSLLDT